MITRSRVGILGGMGPSATVSLFQKIIDNTPARTDQEHLDIIIANLPRIPDRTKALISEGEDPVEQMQEGIDILLNSGVKIILIACNTAHAFLSRLDLKKKAVVIDLIQSVYEQIIQEHAYKKVGLLATNGTIQTGLYEQYFLEVGLLYPDLNDQNELMDIIYGDNGIKTIGVTKTQKIRLKKIIKRLVRSGAECIVLGCTELPLVIKQSDIDIKCIDPMEVVAIKVVKMIKNI